MRIDVLYFASLRDVAGCDGESVNTGATDARSLYEELRTRHGFPFETTRLRAAIDGVFVDWSAPLHEGAELAFLPPVSGG
jgi:molybdopterin converting factor small subunit